MAEERTDLAVQFEMLLTVVVDQIQMVPNRVALDFDVFAQFDVSFGPEDDPAPVASGAEPPFGVSQSARK